MWFSFGPALEGAGIDFPPFLKEPACSNQEIGSQWGAGSLDQFCPQKKALLLLCDGFAHASIGVRTLYRQVPSGQKGAVAARAATALPDG
jgi:hypothetical protein